MPDKVLIGLIALLSLNLVSCTRDTEKMYLTGNIKGLKKGTLFLQKQKDTALVSIDSMIIDGSAEFSFSEILESPEIYYLYLVPKDGSLRDDRIAFFAEKGDIKITSNLKNFGSAAVVSGSSNQMALDEYLKLKDRYVLKNLRIIEEKLKMGSNVSDSARRQLEQKQRALLSSQYLATINFAINHNDQEVAPYLMLSEAYDANVKYLDTVFKALTPKIKDSKYGKELESFIESRKKTDTVL